MPGLEGRFTSSRFDSVRNKKTRQLRLWTHRFAFASDQTEKNMGSDRITDSEHSLR